jgi:hypothetical protein
LLRVELTDEANAKPYDDWEAKVMGWEKERQGSHWMPRP